MGLDLSIINLSQKTGSKGGEVKHNFDLEMVVTHLLASPKSGPNVSPQSSPQSRVHVLHLSPYTIRILAFNYRDVISIKAESPKVNAKKLDLCHRNFFHAGYEVQKVRLCSVDSCIWIASLHEF